MCVVYGVLALLGFLQAVLLQQVFDFTLPDNILHAAIFALSLIVYIGAIFEQRTLDQLAGHAQTFRQNEGKPRAASYAVSARARNPEPLDFAQLTPNRWGGAGNVGQSRITGANDLMGANGLATAPVSALEERMRYLENEVRSLQQQVSRLSALEAEVKQYRAGFGMAAPASRPAPFAQPGTAMYPPSGWPAPQNQNRTAQDAGAANASWSPDGWYGGNGANAAGNPYGNYSNNQGFDQEEWPKI